MNIDYSKLSNVFVENIKMNEYPNFNGAYIGYAEYEGNELSQSHINYANENCNIHNYIWNQIIDSNDYNVLINDY